MVAGQNLAGLDESGLARLRRYHMGIVFQSFHLLPTMTARENVAIPLELAGRGNAFALAEAALARVGLGHRLRHYPGRLAGGEQQRVAIARAFVAGPALLLADEPTGNLDRATGAAVIDHLFDEHARLGSALLLITHDAALRQTLRAPVRSGRWPHPRRAPTRRRGRGEIGPPCRRMIPRPPGPPRRIYGGGAGGRCGRASAACTRRCCRDSRSRCRNGGVDPAALFTPRPAEVWLEIGFGAGEHLAAQAEAHPATGFVGCEVFESGVARLVAESPAAASRISGFSRTTRGAARRAGAGIAGRYSSCSRSVAEGGNTSAVSSRTRHWTAGDLMRPGAELRLAIDDRDYSPGCWSTRRPTRLSDGGARPGRLARAPRRLATDPLRGKGPRRRPRAGLSALFPPLSPLPPPGGTLSSIDPVAVRAERSTKIPPLFCLLLLPFPPFLTSPPPLTSPPSATKFRRIVSAREAARRSDMLPASTHASSAIRMRR